MLEWSTNRLIGSLSDVRRASIDATPFAVSICISTTNTSVSLVISPSRTRILHHFTENSLVIHSHLCRIRKDGGILKGYRFTCKTKRKKRSVGGIILHGSVANRYEFFHPDDDLLDDVSEDDCFAIALLEFPGFLRADLLFLLGFFEGSGEYISMVDFRQVKTVPELDRESS